MINTIAQFIPIVVIYILLAQYRGCIEFSHTVIGKLFAISAIIFYSMIDTTIGLFVCALIILFYQMDCTENMLNMEAFHDIEGKTMAQYIEEKEPPPLEYEEIKPAKSSSKTPVEAFENVSEGYGHDEVQNAFRQQNCKNGTLKYKNMQVNNEMASHIFPEIKFTDDYCNACRPSCKFSIIEAKFRAEDKIEQQDKSS
jgi:hypothetical protein